MKALSKYKQKLFVSLGSEINVEYFFQYSTNEKIEELLKPRGLVYYQVESLKEASKLCRKFIDHFRLGSSSWSGGRIIDKESHLIAFVSYNGRIWESDHYPCKEIKL